MNNVCKFTMISHFVKIIYRFKVQIMFVYYLSVKIILLTCKCYYILLSLVQ